MAIARNPCVAIDCSDPTVLANFYAALLDWKIVEDDGGWVEVHSGDGQCIAMQRVEDYKPPTWPTQVVPQQMHLDVDVDDLDDAEADVIALGATRHDYQPGTTFRVMLDPAGHPFCLCVGWRTS